MKVIWRPNCRKSVLKARDRRWPPSSSSGEEGQGLLEAAVAFMFLLVLLLVMFEMAVVFASYIALLNTSVQGCIYAAGQFDSGRDLQMQVCQDDECVDPIADAECCNYLHYRSILRNEAMGGGLSYSMLGISLPEPVADVQPGSPITVTTHYSMTTFASEIVFPMFAGRLGLPSRYFITARHACSAR